MIPTTVSPDPHDPQNYRKVQPEYKELIEDLLTYYMLVYECAKTFSEKGTDLWDFLVDVNCWEGVCKCINEEATGYYSPDTMLMNFIWRNVRNIEGAWGRYPYYASKKHDVLERLDIRIKILHEELNLVWK